jgi:hypothetical protein
MDKNRRFGKEILLENCYPEWQRKGIACFA